MKCIIKYFIAVILALLLLPVVAFFSYDFVVFQPRVAEIKAILEQVDPQDRNPPASIPRYIRAAGEQPSRFAARLLLERFNLRRNGSVPWHLRYMLWEKLVSLHLSESEILGLYLSLSNDGFNAASRRLFDKPLDKLTDEESATLVAFFRAPAFYSHDRQKLEQRRDLLLKKAEESDVR